MHHCGLAGLRHPRPLQPAPTPKERGPPSPAGPHRQRATAADAQGAPLAPLADGVAKFVGSWLLGDIHGMNVRLVLDDIYGINVVDMTSTSCI